MPLKAVALGMWPMPRNIAETGRTYSSPETRFLRRRPLTSFSSTPSTSSTVVLETNLMLGWAMARSSMIFEARNRSVRLMSVILVAKRVRKRASSMAESPPPMTAISLPEKKNPSQVAQELTPWPINACSDGRLSQRALAPEAMMSVRVWMVSWPRLSSKGRFVRSMELRWAMRSSAPKRTACFFMFSMRSGPWMPSGQPGKFSTRVVMESCPPGSWPSRTQRLQVGSCSVDGSGKSGAPGAEDDSVARRIFRHMDSISVNALRRKKMQRGHW